MCFRHDFTPAKISEKMLFAYEMRYTARAGIYACVVPAHRGHCVSPPKKLSESPPLTHFHHTAPNMKLHLPKRLFTALLTAITLATAPTALTLGSSAWGVTNIEVNTSWSGGDATDKGGISVSNNAELTITDGTYQSESGKLELKGGGNLTMNGGCLNVNQIHVHNQAASTTETLTLAGGVINVLQEFQTANNNSTVLIGHWPNGLGKVEVTAGTLNVLGGYTTVGWDSSGILSVSGSGVVNTMGIALLKDNSSGVELSGGRLNVGTLGIMALDKGGAAGKLDLQSGTLGVLSQEGWSLGQNISTTIGTITIDTNVWDAATQSSTSTGANISLLGNIEAAEGGINITLNGSGSLTINRTLNTVETTGTARIILVNTEDSQKYGATYVNSQNESSVSGWVKTYRVAQAGSTFADDKVYIGQNGYNVTDGVIDVQGLSTIYYINDAQVYDSSDMAGATAYWVYENGSFDISAATEFSTPITNSGRVDISKSSDLSQIINQTSGEVYLLGAEGQQLLKFDGTFSNATFQSTVEGSTVTATQKDGNYAGNITVLKGTTLKSVLSTDVYSWNHFGAANLNRLITVEGGGTLDVNGASNYYKVELHEGAILANDAIENNTGNANGVINHMQLPVVTLTGDAEVRAVSDFGMVGRDYENTTLALNGHTLTKTGAGKFTVVNTTIGAGTILVNNGTFASHTAANTNKDANLTAANIVVNESGTFELSGANESMANLTLNGGTLKTDNYTLTVTGKTVFNGGTVNGNLTAGNIMFSSAVELNTGKTFTVTDGATVVIDAQSFVGSQNGISFVTAGDVSATSGFIRANNPVSLVNNNGGTITLGNNITATFNGAQNVNLKYVDNRLVLSMDETGSVFYVNENLVYNATTMAGATGFYISENATLGTIDSNAGSVKLYGSGTYDLASNTKVMTNNVTLDTGWTGAVKVSNLTGDKNQLSALLTAVANVNSSALLTGVYAWAGRDTMTRNMILCNAGDTPALTINNGSSGANSTITATYDASISGTGDFAFAWNKDVTNCVQVHKFTRDTSEWSGRFINENSGKLIVRALFTKAGDVFSATDDGGGILNKNTNSDGKMQAMFDSTGTIDFYGTIGKAEGASNMEVLVERSRVNFHKQVNADVMQVANSATAALYTNATIGSMSLGSSASLYLGNGSNESSHSITSLTAGEGSTIVLDSKATLDRIGSVTTVKLTGTGTYNLGANTTTNVAGLNDSDSWSGTVVLNGAQSVVNLDINDYGNNGSTVQLIGVNGHFHAGESDQLEITPDIIFGNTNGESVAGFTHTNGYSNTVYTFSGKISGTGNYVNSRNDGTVRSTFNGDVSDWTGAYINEDIGDSNLTFGGNATDIKANIEATAGTLNLYFNEAVDTIDMSGAITKGANSGTITITVNSSAEFNNTIKATSTLVNSVATFNSSLTLTGNLTFGANELNQVVLNASGNSVFILDMSNNGNAKGELVLKKGATLQITNGVDLPGGALWMQANRRILLEEKASLSWGTAKVIGTAGDKGEILSGTNTNQKLTTNSLSLSNVELQVTDTNDSTVSAILINSSVTNNGSGTLTVNDGNDLTAVTATSGSVAVNSDAVKINNVTVGTGENRKVSLQNDALVITATDSTAEATMTQKADTQGSLSRLQEDASFTIQDMTLTNTTITAATTRTRVNLNNVSVAAGSVATLAKGAFAVQNQATVGTGGGEVDFTTSSYSGFTLGSAESAASITLNLGDLSQVKPMGPRVYESITILLEDFHMTEGNASILFAADSWLGQLLSSQGANAYVSGSLDAPASVSEGGSGSSVSVSYSAATGDNVGTIITITGLNVPEPTTSTLSLLALAALAARRRRK